MKTEAAMWLMIIFFYSGALSAFLGSARSKGEKIFNYGIYLTFLLPLVTLFLIGLKYGSE